MVGFVSRSDFIHAKGFPPFAMVRAFDAVGRLGGVRRAALELTIDHTVVSRHVRSLEEWLGTALFVRANGRLQLTASGLVYHQRISSALIEIARATADVAAPPDMSEIRVWCVPGFATQWVGEALSEFERIWPDYSTELRPSERPADLMMHEADVDIRYYLDDSPLLPKDHGLNCFVLARPEIMAVASPDLAQQLKGMSSAADFLNTKLLHEDSDEEWRSWLRGNGVAVDAKLPGPLLWHAHLALGAAKLGRGVALGSRYLVEKDLGIGALERICPPGASELVIGSYTFCTREDRARLPALKRLRAFLAKRAAN